MKEVFMKVLPLILLMMLCLVFCSTKDQGTQGSDIKELPGVTFEKMSLQDTLAKAQKENKVLMIDNYTDT